MSKPSPYNNISISEGGRFVRYEWDVHYLTDEQMETVRKYIETLQAENAKLLDQKADAYNDMVNAQLDADALQAEIAMLKELVRDMAAEIRGLGIDFKRVGWCDYADRMRELGIEVD